MFYAGEIENVVVSARCSDEPLGTPIPDGSFRMLLSFPIISDCPHDGNMIMQKKMNRPSETVRERRTEGRF